ncbi:MAG: hypothetical protein K5930_01370 [Treponemataceae bacterium]|nr:hypothetical protein [Treponemataceae bacterium]
MRSGNVTDNRLLRDGKAVSARGLEMRPESDLALGKRREGCSRGAGPGQESLQALQGQKGAVKVEPVLGAEMRPDNRLLRGGKAISVRGLEMRPESDLALGRRRESYSRGGRNPGMPTDR